MDEGSVDGIALESPAHTTFSTDSARESASETTLALLVLLGLFFFACPKEKILQVAMALATAGVCGNLYDRLFNNGLVRDFIDVVYWPGRHWPTFNVADSLLCIAVALMAVSIFVTGRPCQKYDRPQKSEPSTPR